MKTLTDNDFQATLPDVQSTMQLYGLNRPVVIHHDPWGISPIAAETTQDMFFAQGFATAQDRHWHMNYDLMRTLGRWVEWAGEDALAQNRLLRTAGMGRTAQLDYQTSAPGVRGITYGAADTQNLYIERFRSTADGTMEYQFEGKWRPAHVLDEVIYVRGAKEVETKVVITRHGPVIAENPSIGWGITVSDPGLIAGTPSPNAALEAMRCRSLYKLHQAFEKWTDRVNNYAVADIHENFSYLHEGKIPKHGEANGWQAVLGWNGEYEWKGTSHNTNFPRRSIRKWNTQ